MFTVRNRHGRGLSAAIKQAPYRRHVHEAVAAGQKITVPAVFKWVTPRVHDERRVTGGSRPGPACLDTLGLCAALPARGDRMGA